MMTLADLAPAWIVPPTDGDGFIERVRGPRPQTLWGIHFTCPKCGDHAVHCLTKGAPEFMEPLPGRWSIEGGDIDTVSLLPSVDIPCGAHFWVRGGVIRFVGAG